MFGRFVLRALSVLLILITSLGVAAQKGTVIAEESYIYVDADFDAKIIATVRKGQVFEISDNVRGPFYRIRLQNKRLGWISSVDIKPGQVKTSKQKRPEPLNSYKDEKREENRFVRKRFQGPRFEQLGWREKTMGHVHHDQLTLFGWGWTGMDTFWAGPFFMDSSVTISLQAPEYYKQATGMSASGYILKMQTALLSPRPLGDRLLYFYGLGPVLTYSHFETHLLQNGRRLTYNLDDLMVGLAIPIGIAYRWGPFSASAWYRYYWEQQTTSSLSLGLGWVF